MLKPLTTIGYFLIAFLAIGIANANDLSDKQEKLDKLRSKITAVQQKINRQQSKKGGVESQIKALDKQVASLSKKIKTLNSESAKYDQQLLQLKHQLEAAKSNIGTHQENLMKQLRAAYVMGKQPKLKVLLNQEDPSAISRMQIYFRYVNLAQNEVISKAQVFADQLLSVQREILRATKGLFSTRARLLSEHKKLDQARIKRKQTIAALTKSIKKERSSLTHMKADRQALEALIKQLDNILADIPDSLGEKQPFKKLKGKLIQPVSGKNIIKFGTRKAYNNLRWNGILIDAKEGTQVHAVSHGQVIFASWMRGFGYLVILDHGGGYLSLYGYNQLISKDVGDWVVPGDVIALVGGSGGQNKSGLYFEIRYRGKPVNPARWITKYRGSR